MTPRSAEADAEPAAPGRARAPLRCAGRSDAGRVREGNEDRFHVDPERGLLIVVDGMGGQAAGEVAAERALESLRRYLEAASGPAEERVREAIARANNEVHHLAQRHPEWQGMGCVLTLALVEDGDVTVGHVGDSRLYHLSDGALRKVTHDHSPVGVREDANELGEREAMFHPRRNEVFRSVGAQEHGPLDPDFIETARFALGEADAVLLCSDGLTDLVTAAEIETVLRGKAPDLEAIAEGLIAKATEAGGKDTVTVVVAAGERVGLGPARREPAPRPRAAKPAPPASPDARPTSWNRRSTFFVLGAVVGIALFAAFSLLDRTRPFARGGAAAVPLAPRAPRSLGVGPGAEFASIGDALAAASAGDTVRIGAGRYREQVHLEEGVTLLGDPGGEVVVSPPADGSAGLSAVVIEDLRSGRVADLTVAPAEGAPIEVGVEIRGATVSIEHVTVRGARRAGIAIEGAATPTVIGCTLRDNEGPGVRVATGVRARLAFNRIDDNGRAAHAPGVELAPGARAALEGNVITGNGAEGVRGAPAQERAALLRANVFEVAGRRNARGALGSGT